MRVYSTHTKKKAYSVSKMTSGSAGEGEVSETDYAKHLLSLFKPLSLPLCAFVKEV